ncbi:MAG TPA: DUF5684 domain-containing protein [Candidatus Saccharimonadales bacterium]
MNALSSFTHLFANTSYDSYSVDMSNTAAYAVLGSLLLFMAISIVVVYVVMAFLLSRIFKKAGVEGWKAWVPVYNTWMTYELGGQKGWWALIMLVPVVNIVAAVFLYIAMYQIGRKFGKEDYFVLWAIFLPIVWYVWLAFDQSTWHDTPATKLS